MDIKIVEKVKYLIKFYAVGFFCEVSQGYWALWSENWTVSVNLNVDLGSSLGFLEKPNSSNEIFLRATSTSGVR